MGACGCIGGETDTAHGVRTIGALPLAGANRFVESCRTVGSRRGGHLRCVRAAPASVSAPGMDGAATGFQPQIAPMSSAPAIVVGAAPGTSSLSDSSERSRKEIPSTVAFCVAILNEFMRAGVDSGSSASLTINAFFTWNSCSSSLNSAFASSVCLRAVHVHVCIAADGLAEGDVFLKGRRDFDLGKKWNFRGRGYACGDAVDWWPRGSRWHWRRQWGRWCEKRRPHRGISLEASAYRVQSPGATPRH